MPRTDHSTQDGDSMFRLTLRRPQSARVVEQFLASVFLAVPLAAGAVDLELKFEPGVAFLVSSPQSGA